MNLISKLILAFILSAAAAMQVRAGSDASVDSLLRVELLKKYPGATIEFTAPTRIDLSRVSASEGVELSKMLSSVKLIQEGAGVADFILTLKDGTVASGSAPFVAQVSTFVANRRIRPGERLSRADFVLQTVKVSEGLSREYRALMLTPDTALETLETRQTILEGQYPLSSGVQKIPDIRRGDAVQIRLISGEIELMTAGTAQEPASLGAPIRVMTGKTKKELMGKALSNGIVEVKL